VVQAVRRFRRLPRRLPAASMTLPDALKIATPAIADAKT
jgi:hypothetical protein